ncbi:unnamed protein product [Rodentolepis nana]|uniref:F-box domain-containing protein n=1 Tax=Rodentolepis nana TaxID=102285 RepID=A0A0R3T3G7_RODNA|nr:unnamed protein product [Rodentolepis nana]
MYFHNFESLAVVRSVCRLSVMEDKNTTESGKGRVRSLKELCAESIAKNLTAVATHCSDCAVAKLRWRFPHSGYRIASPGADMIMKKLADLRILTSERLALFSKDQVNLHCITLRDSLEWASVSSILRDFTLFDVTARNSTCVRMEDIAWHFNESTIENLHTLKLVNMGIGESKYPMIAALAQLQNLRHLDISQSSFDNDCLYNLTRALTRLQYLDISETAVTDITFLVELRENLTSLKMHGLKINERSLCEAALSTILELKELRVLDISRTLQRPYHRFPAVGQLIEPGRFPHLEYFDMSGNLFGLTVKDVETFITNNMNLKFLGVAHGIDQLGIGRLPTKYPNIELVVKVLKEVLENTGNVYMKAVRLIRERLVRGALSEITTEVLTEIVNYALFIMEFHWGGRHDDDDDSNRENVMIDGNDDNDADGDNLDKNSSGYDADNDGEGDEEETNTEPSIEHDEFDDSGDLNHKAASTVLYNNIEDDRRPYDYLLFYLHGGLSDVTSSNHGDYYNPDKTADGDVEDNSLLLSDDSDSTYVPSSPSIYDDYYEDDDDDDFSGSYDYESEEYSSDESDAEDEDEADDRYLTYGHSKEGIFIKFLKTIFRVGRVKYEYIRISLAVCKVLKYSDESETRDHALRLLLDICGRMPKSILTELAIHSTLMETLIKCAVEMHFSEEFVVEWITGRNDKKLSYLGHPFRQMDGNGYLIFSILKKMLWSGHEVQKRFVQCGGFEVCQEIQKAIYSDDELDELYFVTFKVREILIRESIDYTDSD